MKQAVLLALGLLALGLVVCISVSVCYFDKVSTLVVDSQGDVPTEEDENFKYNTYIELNNYIVKDFAEILDEYFKDFGDGQEFRFEKYFSFTLRSISKCDRQNLEKAFMESFRNPKFGAVDDSLQGLYPQMTELMNLFEETRSYYVLKKYANNDDVKGRELHEKVLACYKVYSPLAEKYCNNLRAVAKEREKSSLRKFSNKGDLLRYHWLRVLIKAEDLQRNFENQKITSANILDWNLPKFK